MPKPTTPPTKPKSCVQPEAQKRKRASSQEHDPQPESEPASKTPRKASGKSMASLSPAAAVAAAAAATTTTRRTAGPARRYFMIIASRDHLRRAISEGIVQANHGRKAPLARMAPGDGIVLYSPRTHLAKDAPVCRRFTGIGSVAEGEAYQVQLTETWQAWRRDARWRGAGAEKVHEVEMKDVLARLECLGHGQGRNYGMVLRRGFLEIGKADWDVLWQSMVGGDEDGGGERGEE